MSTVAGRWRMFARQMAAQLLQQPTDALRPGAFATVTPVQRGYAARQTGWVAQDLGLR